MSLGQTLKIGDTVGVFAAGGSFLYPAIVTQVVPSGDHRHISVTAFPLNAAPMAVQRLNHRTLSSDGAGWDFASAMPSYSL